MTSQWLYLFAASITLSAIGFVCVAVIWLRKLRQTVSGALTNAAGQQVDMTQRLNQSVAELQKQQDNYTDQIRILAQAGIRLQQELNSLTTRLDNSQAENERSGRTLH